MANIDEKGFMGNPNVARINVQREYTPEQLSELAKCSNDPIYFIENYCKIISLDNGVIPFKMYDAFKEYVTTVNDNRYVLLSAGRQLGKCSWYNTNYTVRNKITGVVESVTAKEFHDRIKH